MFSINRFIDIVANPVPQLWEELVYLYLSRYSLKRVQWKK